MIYLQQTPKADLSFLIKSFWEIDSEGDRTIDRQKIIPDGYPEMIFHTGDPFRANIEGAWQIQALYLIAGQINNFFLLENTGRSAMFAIKFQPWALRVLFDLDMFSINNKVIAIESPILGKVKGLMEIAINASLSFSQKWEAIENYLLNTIAPEVFVPTKGILATKIIIETKGQASLKDIREKVGIGERSLERYFKTHIGLSPKHYSRIIRFSNVFKLLRQETFNWSAIAYLAGFYDQSHFIKNFKEFTGEGPSKYGFTEENMANFFLRK